MQKLHRHFSTKSTPQMSPLNESQVVMRSGGYGWEVNDWIRLDRFLILGSEGGTYYVGERRLTREAAEAVLRCIKQDGVRVVDRIVEISELNLGSRPAKRVDTRAIQNLRAIPWTFSWMKPSWRR